MDLILHNPTSHDLLPGPGGWHEHLSREDNQTAYEAIPAIEALGVHVVDIGPPGGRHVPSLCPPITIWAT
ncbi:hypothetical protein ACU635_59560 [[Actinomadura] parvosata]|uniref:hypothetical protein n=1 Tax=[Actinomadura] parvosata TaxID=1955412 RepID=UPI00406C8907